MEEQQQAQIALSAAEVSPQGIFDILAITAGRGNGWEFSAEVLQLSLALWERVECFIDHSLSGRSIRDLAGMCSEPGWDAARQGIRLKLQVLGPSGPMLAALGQALLVNNSRRPKVGFSADLTFTAQGRKVERIIKVNSVDLVVDPARGGEFLRALNSRSPNHSNEGENMTEVLEPQAAAPDLARQEQINTSLLEAGLAAAHLPLPLVERVRQRFARQAFTSAELQAAIDDARALLSELTGPAAVAGPNRVLAMFDSRDRLQAAVDDLFGVQRDPDLEGVKAERLGGVRELYLLLTGDYDLHGGYYPERARLATTADFTGLVKNALNKIVTNTWDELGRAGYDWWQKVVTVEHFNSLAQITGTLVGTVGALPEVAEGAEYTELAVGDSPEVGTFKKYGGYIPLTLELIDRDETRKLRAYPRELAAAGLRKISALVAAVFTDASGAGPTMADGGALFNSTAVTSAGGHANLRTTALSGAEWEAVSAAVYNQPLLIKNAAGYYGSGPKMAINPKYMLVPRALQLTAKQVLYPTLERATSIVTENQQRGEPGDVVTVPEWTDANDWAAVCDPRIAPAIFVGERFGLVPEIFIAGDELSPAVFTNDEHRLKVRHTLAVWVNDWRPLAKNNVP